MAKDSTRCSPSGERGAELLGEAPAEADGSGVRGRAGVLVERHLSLVVVALRAERGSEIRVKLGVDPPALLGLLVAAPRRGLLGHTQGSTVNSSRLGRVSFAWVLNRTDHGDADRTTLAEEQPERVLKLAPDLAVNSGAWSS